MPVDANTIQRHKYILRSATLQIARPEKFTQHLQAFPFPQALGPLGRTSQPTMIGTGGDDKFLRVPQLLTRKGPGRVLGHQGVSAVTLTVEWPISRRLRFSVVLNRLKHEPNSGWNPYDVDLGAVVQVPGPRLVLSDRGG